jgi:hypothetical protein
MTITINRMRAFLTSALEALLCWYLKRLERQITRFDPHRLSTCC